MDGEDKWGIGIWGVFAFVAAVAFVLMFVGLYYAMGRNEKMRPEWEDRCIASGGLPIVTRREWLCPHIPDRR